MKSPTQKRKLHNEITHSAKSRIRDDILQSVGVGQETLEGERVPRRGRPPKNIQALRNHGARSSTSPTLAPNKKRKREEATSQAQRIQAESFVMKLFDRSLDLSKYTENTSLYPICRAWMANQPRNPSIRSYWDRRSPSPEERKDNCVEMLSQLKNGNLTEVSVMPKPKIAEVPKIPFQNKLKSTITSAGLNEICDKFKGATREGMLNLHLSKWKQVKTDWIKHVKDYQQRNELNFQIIEELFTP